MKIAIAGSGAMGSRFGFMLHEAGNDVVLIDNWEKHVNMIRNEGLTVEKDKKKHVVNIPVYRPSELTEEVDVVFMFTKSMYLGGMLEDIQPILGSETNVVCLLNGVGHEEILKDYLPLENIFMGVTILTSQLVGPGHIAFEGSGLTEIQNFVEGEEQEKNAREIVSVLNNAGLESSYSDDVMFSIWRKACVNGAMNATCALLDSNLAEFGSTDQTKDIIESIVKEFAQVAGQRGTTLDVDDMVDYTLASVKAVGHHYPSMHQDLIQNHRLTEVDFLNGAVARMAKGSGSSAPVNEVIAQLIHAKEQLLDAK